VNFSQRGGEGNLSRGMNAHLTYLKSLSPGKRTASLSQNGKARHKQR
jgi:hypothetical protein